jgi:hypothetical protein
MSDKFWDIFISHASEDKEAVARPLAAALKKAGARVWLDEHELKLGDSLSGRIDHGLASSRFGVVVLSPSFLAKRWAKTELAGLRAIEEDGRKVILPVWHNVDKATVAKSSPVVADLLAISTSEGIEKVASAILDVIFSPGSESPSVRNPSVSRRPIELLNSKHSKAVLTQAFVARVREELSRRIEISPTQIEITGCERQGLTHFKLFVKTSMELKAFWKSFFFGRDIGYIKEAHLEVIADISGEVIAVKPASGIR